MRNYIQTQEQRQTWKYEYKKKKSVETIFNLYNLIHYLNDLLITFQVKILLMSFISFGIKPRYEAPGDLLAEFHKRIGIGWVRLSPHMWPKVGLRAVNKWRKNTQMHLETNQYKKSNGEKHVLFKCIMFQNGQTNCKIFKEGLTILGRYALKW